MVEEASINEKSEMSPQEDGTKVPLTNDDPVVNIEEAKYVSNPNGDAKIDIEVPPTFTGLTKEQLMKYTNDPFWVRLRWSLFILFWAGWLAMLVVAIVIIIQAPGCKPPPELQWVEEHPMAKINPRSLPTEQELLTKCSELGLSSVYFPDLIRRTNFQESNYDAEKLITAIQTDKKRIVADLPSSIDPSNPFYEAAVNENLVNHDGSWNYTNDALPSAIFKEIVDVWIAKGVKGFLMEEVDTPEKQRFKDELNILSKEKEGSIGSDIVNARNKYSTPSAFRAFLESHSGNWSFYEFNPTRAIGSSISEENLRLVTMGLFLASGTPILIDYRAIDNSTSELISVLTEMKSRNSIKFGNTNFVNSTDDLVAFTRVYKGTPAYAVALNFNDYNTTVNFESTENVGDSGTLEIFSKKDANLYKTDSKKYKLNDIFLEAYEGIILQFVAAF